MRRSERASRRLQRSGFLAVALMAMLLGTTARAEQIAVRHVQLPMHAEMVTRNEAGKIIARIAVTQAVEGDEVTIRRTYHFVDGSMDDDTTTYRQQGTFRLMRDREIRKGPFFADPLDFAVNANSGTATTRTVDNHGKTHVETEHFDLPDDLANGMIGTLLLNVPKNTPLFRVGMLVPVNGGRLIRLLISPEGERTFSMDGKTRQATLFRIHPELGGFLGVIAQPLGLQPKDVTVWVLQGGEPEVVRIVGQLGGSGPVVDSELVGASF